MNNKVFSIELCKEDAERMLCALELYKEQYESMVDYSNKAEDKTELWLETSYISELKYMLEDVFELNMW